MNQVLHLIAADLRRFRWPMVGLILLTISVAVLEGVRPIVARGVASVELAHSLVWIASNVLALVLVAVVIQADALVGSDVFWMTRPIKPWALLTSKAALLVVVMIVVPVLCEAALLTAYRAPAGPVARMAAQSAVFDALWLAAAISLAALTPNLARFAALLGVLIVGLAASIVVTTTVMMARFDDMPPSDGGMTVSDPTGMFVWTVLMTAALTGLVLAQYRTRSRWRSVGVGAAGAILACVVATVWPWPFLRAHLDLPEWAKTAPTLSLSADPASVEFPAEGIIWGRGARWRSGRARVHVSSVDPHWFTRVSLQNAIVVLDSGVSLTSLSGAYGAAVPFATTEEQPERTVLRELLLVQRFAETEPPKGEPLIVLTLLRSDFARETGSSGSYRGRFQLNLFRDEIVAILPLRGGASVGETHYRFVIDGISQPDTETLRLRAHESHATSIFDRRPDVQFAYYLRNLRAAEAVAGSLRVPADEIQLFAGSAFHVSRAYPSGIRGVLLDFPGYGVLGKSFALDDAWIANAELVIVRTIPGESVQRTLEIPGFTLRAAPPASVDATGK